MTETSQRKKTDSECVPTQEYWRRIGTKLIEIEQNAPVMETFDLGLHAMRRKMHDLDICVAIRNVPESWVCSPCECVSSNGMLSSNCMDLMFRDARIDSLSCREGSSIAFWLADRMTHMSHRFTLTARKSDLLSGEPWWEEKRFEKDLMGHHALSGQRDLVYRAYRLYLQGEKHGECVFDYAMGFAN